MTDREHAERTGTPDRSEPAAGRPIGPRRRATPVRPASIRIDTDNRTQVARDECAIDRLCIDTIRTLSMDAVQQAASGHPGTSMALAPVVYTLWQSFLRFDPQDPGWPDRDRFILSNGHASMLLYAVLHLAGVAQADASSGHAGARAVTLDDVVHFRQLGSGSKHAARRPGWTV